MRCPKCNSENVQIHAKEYKPKLTVPIILACGGFGLMFFGIGAIVGVVIGTIIAAIVNSALPQAYQSIMVCQNCGYMSEPMTRTQLGTKQHPLFCDSSESNLEVVRNDVAKGTIILIRVRIDYFDPFDIGDNSTVNLKLTEGNHVFSYEQVNGIGRKKNKGQFNILVGDKKTVTISFTRQGLIVK